MFFANLGFFTGLISTLVGIFWFIAKMLKDDTKKFSLPMALFCWGSIDFLVFFVLGTQHAQSPTEDKIMTYYGVPVLIGAAIFIASLPVLMWLEEHDWKDKILCRLTYGVLCLTFMVPFIFYKFMN